MLWNFPRALQEASPDIKARGGAQRHAPLGAQKTTHTPVATASHCPPSLGFHITETNELQAASGLSQGLGRPPASSRRGGRKEPATCRSMQGLSSSFILPCQWPGDLLFSLQVRTATGLQELCWL